MHRFYFYLLYFSYLSFSRVGGEETSRIGSCTYKRCYAFAIHPPIQGWAAVGDACIQMRTAVGGGARLFPIPIPSFWPHSLSSVHLLFISFYPFFLLRFLHPNSWPMACDFSLLLSTLDSASINDGMIRGAPAVIPGSRPTTCGSGPTGMAREGVRSDNAKRPTHFIFFLSFCFCLLFPPVSQYPHHSQCQSTRKEQPSPTKLVKLSYARHHWLLEGQCGTVFLFEKFGIQHFEYSSLFGSCRAWVLCVWIAYTG